MSQLVLMKMGTSSTNLSEKQEMQTLNKLFGSSIGCTIILGLFLGASPPPVPWFDNPTYAEFIESGKHIYKLKVEMSEQQIFNVLKLGRFFDSKLSQSKTHGGAGVGGVETIYFTHLKNCRFSILTKLDGSRILKWKSRESALITIDLGKEPTDGRGG